MANALSGAQRRDRVLVEYRVNGTGWGIISVFTLLFFVWITCSICCGNTAAVEIDCTRAGAKQHNQHERHLLNCLLHEDYDPAVRPATSPNEPVDVIVDSVIGAIVGLVSTSDVGLLGYRFFIQKLIKTWLTRNDWDSDRFAQDRILLLPPLRRLCTVSIRCLWLWVGY